MSRVKHLIIKYRSIPITVKATIWFAVCTFLQRSISLIITPFYTRALTYEEYGLTSAYTAWETVLFIITSLCLHRSLMNIYVKHDISERDDILSSIIFLELVVTIIWLILYFSIHKTVVHVMGLPSVLCSLLFFSCIFNAAIQCWIIHQRYSYNYKGAVFFTFIMTFLSSFLGVFTVLFITRTALGKILPYVVIMTLFGIYAYGYSYKRSKKIFDKENWAFAISFCIPLLPHYLSEFILQSSDRLMINSMCGTVDVAIYSVAYSIGGILSMATFAIDASFAPFEYEAIKKKNYNELSVVSTGVLVIVAVFVILIMLFGREIVLIIGGTKYLESEKTIIPISIGLYFNYVFRFFARVQEYYEHKRSIVIPSVLSAALNVILNYYFISKNGYIAAAYTTLVCYFIFCLVHYYFYKRTVISDNQGVELYDVKSIIKVSGVVVFGGIIIHILGYKPYIKYGCVLIIAFLSILRRMDIVRYLKRLMESMR